MLCLSMFDLIFESAEQSLNWSVHSWSNNKHLINFNFPFEKTVLRVVIPTARSSLDMGWRAKPGRKMHLTHPL